MSINGVNANPTTNTDTSPIDNVNINQLKDAFKGVCKSLQEFTSIGKELMAKQFHTLSSFYENRSRIISNLDKAVTGFIKEEIVDLKNSKIIEKISNKISSLENFFTKGQTMGEILSFSGVSLQELKGCKEIRESFWNALNSTEQNAHSIKKPQDKLRFLNAFQKELERCKYSEDVAKALNKIQQSKTNLQSRIDFQELVQEAKEGKPLARLVSEKFGGEIIETKNINLTYGEKSCTLNVTHTPQKIMSGFGNDSDMLQCSSLHGKSEHAKNLFKQSVNVGDKSINFLRFSCTRGVPEASKEVLANALALNYSEKEITESTQENPLSLKFSSTQLMTTGILGDRNKMFEQIDGFKALKGENQSIELNWQGRKVFVKLEEPVLFNFGVNWQHFILPRNKEDAALNDINLGSFKHVFGDNFPNIDPGNFGGEVKAFLENPKVNAGDKEKVKILSEQIIDICKKSPKGINKNPYALPCRVIVLTNLLGYASSYNCKSGKDRTGVCSIELSNLVGQLFTENKLSNPFASISQDEQKNLQNIYLSGSAIEIAKTNTGNVQNYLKVQESPAWHSIEDRFGVKMSTPIEQNRTFLET